MSQQDNVRLVQDALDAWNKHDPERFVALLDDKHVIESDTLPAPMTGREAGGQFMQVYVNAFPDLRLDNEQILGSGDFVVASDTMLSISTYNVVVSDNRTRRRVA